jgi:hypothetical protein
LITLRSRLQPQNSQNPQKSCVVPSRVQLFLKSVFCVFCVFCGEFTLASPASAQDTHLLVIVGVGGDEAHTKQFHGWASAIVDAAKKQGVAAGNVTYLGEQPETDPTRISGRATRDSVAKAIEGLAARSGPNDEVFILLIGHGSFDGRTAAFNLPGPDLNAADYANLLKKFTTQRIVFVNTASSSGAFLPVLAGPGRTIIAATKTGGERNETRFPGFFVEALTAEAADRDRNGRVSMLEAFDFAKAKVEETYKQGGHILTEHAALDDGSEGKFAGSLYLAPPRSRSADMASADPKLRALMEEREALEREIASLQQRKNSLDPAAYESQLEKLLTDLALKSRAIRELETKK